MRTANPALNSSTFDTFDSYALERSNTMTLQGTTNKTAMLLVLLSASAGFSWFELRQAGNFQAVMPYFLGGLIASLIAGIALWFKRDWAAVLAPVYAVGEGLVLGVISAGFETKFQGIVFQAVCLTFGTLFSLLTAYRTGLIKPTENFKLGIFAATGAIALLYRQHDHAPVRHGWRDLFAWLQPPGDRHQRGHRGRRRAESGARLRLHRTRSRSLSPQVHGVVRRLRLASDARLALHRDPTIALQAQQPRLIDARLSELLTRVIDMKTEESLAIQRLLKPLGQCLTLGTAR